MNDQLGEEEVFEPAVAEEGSEEEASEEGASEVAAEDGEAAEECEAEDVPSPYDAVAPVATEKRVATGATASSTKRKRT